MPKGYWLQNSSICQIKIQLAEQLESERRESKKKETLKTDVEAKRERMDEGKEFFLLTETIRERDECYRKDEED